MASADQWRAFTNASVKKTNASKRRGSSGSFGTPKKNVVKNTPKKVVTRKTPTRSTATYTSPGVPVRQSGTTVNRRAPAVRSNRTGQYSGVGGGGGEIGGGIAGGMESFAASTGPMDENSFLGSDTTFLSQQSALQKALQDYQAQHQLQLSQYNTDYDIRNKELGQAETQNLDFQQNDFASRGLLNSGIYAGSRTDLQRQFDDREADMLRAKNDYSTNLATELANFQSEQQLTLERARQEALARMSAGFAL